MSGEDEHVDTQLSPLWQLVHPRYGIDDDDDDDDEQETTTAADAHDDDDIDAARSRRMRDEVKRNQRAPRLGQLLRYLNDVDDDEELQQLLLERDPVSGHTLLQWATAQRHYLLVEYLVKRLRRGAFAFDPESVDMIVYTRWQEMRSELPSAAEVVERQRQREEAKAARAAARQQARASRQGGDDDEDDGQDDEDDEEEEDEEDEEVEPMPEEIVYDTLDEYHEQWGARGVGLVRRIGELGVYAGPRRRDGTKHGIGQSLYANGDCYAGAYADNQREGCGTYWWAHGAAVYCGAWHKNLRHGDGRMAYADGAHYVGGWLHNRKHGRGRYTYADGSSYDGAWAHDEKHGTGTYTFVDGSVYHGSFVHNAFVTGEWRLACGTVRYIGSFDAYTNDNNDNDHHNSDDGDGGSSSRAMARRRVATRDVPTGAGVFVHRCGVEATRGARYMQEGVYEKGRWIAGVLRGTAAGAAQVHALVTPLPAAAAATKTTTANAAMTAVRVPLVYTPHTTTTTTTPPPPSLPPPHASPLRMDDLVRVANFAPLLQWLRVVVFASSSSSATTTTTTDEASRVQVERVDVLRVQYDAADAHRLLRVWTRPLLLDARGRRVRRLPMTAVVADDDDDDVAATLCVRSAADDDGDEHRRIAVYGGGDCGDGDSNDENDDVLVFTAPTTRLLVVLDVQASDAHDASAAATPRAPVVLLLQQGGGDGKQRAAAVALYTLPTVSVSRDGALHGDVVERVARALRLQLTHTRHTLVLMRPALYTVMPHTAASSATSAQQQQQQVLVYIQHVHRDALATLTDKLHALPPSLSSHDDRYMQPAAITTTYTALPLDHVASVTCDAATTAALDALQRRRAQQRLPLCTAPPQRPPTPLPPPPQPRPDLQPLYTAKAARSAAAAAHAA